MEKKYLVNYKILEIDIIRCIATIQIVLFHLCEGAPSFLANAVTLWGREGNGLFFAIAGAGLINRYYYHFNCKSYIKKRIIGLYIPFWVAYIAVFTKNYVINGFLFPWEYTEVPVKFMLFSVLGVDCFASAVGISNFALVGEWFLAVIIMIYLIFPLWRKLFIKFPELTVVLFLILRIILTYKNPIPQLAVHFNPIIALSNFSIGAYIVLFLSQRPFNRGDILHRLIAVIASLACVALGRYLALKREQLNIGEIFSTLGLLFIILEISPFIAQHAPKFVKFVSGLSYEILLVHHVIIYAYAPIINRNFSAANVLIGYTYILSMTLIFACALKKVVSFINNFLTVAGLHGKREKR